MILQSRILESAWVALRGRCSRESLSAADGFRGEYPFSSVVIVAEGTGGDERSAGIAVSTIRDVFAEGVAFRVGEALAEALHEAGERIRAEELRGCSVTAVAFLGREAWIAHAGASRAFLVESAAASPLTTEHTLASEMRLEPKDPAYKPRSKDLTSFLGQQDLRPQVVHVELTHSQRIVVMTPGVWHHVPPSRIAAAASRRTDPCETAETLMKESRARFRRSGGAAAVIGEQTGRLSGGNRRRYILPAAIAFAILSALLLIRGLSRGEGRNPAHTPGISPGDADAPWIMPLEMLSVDASEINAGPVLPVRTLVLGGNPVLPSADTLDVYVTPQPDSLYENISRGVYYLSADTVMASFAGDLSARLGFGEPAGVDRILIVRENEVPAFSAWLPGIDPAEAARTVVIVETRSSVAGGAAWIREYAMYANGNRARQGEPSSYIGLPLEGLPAGLDPGCYSLLIAP